MRRSLKPGTMPWLVTVCTVVLILAGSIAWAAHNTITVSVTEATKTNIDGNVEVKNNIAPAQTGSLTLIVFVPNKSGRMIQRAEFDLGQVDLPAGAGSTVNVPFSLDTQTLGLRRGEVKLLADFLSSVNNKPVAHSHCSALTAITEDPK